MLFYITFKHWIQLKYTKISSGFRRDGFNIRVLHIFPSDNIFQNWLEKVFSLCLASYFFSGNAKLRQDKEGENKKKSIYFSIFNSEKQSLLLSIIVSAGKLLVNIRN